MAIGQLTMQKLHFYTAHFDCTTAQIVINCTLKYALKNTTVCFVVTHNVLFSPIWVILVLNIVNRNLFDSVIFRPGRIIWSGLNGFLFIAFNEPDWRALGTRQVRGETMGTGAPWTLCCYLLQSANRAKGQLHGIEEHVGGSGVEGRLGRGSKAKRSLRIGPA